MIEFDSALSGQTAPLPFPPVVLGLAGASGSGKTTLAFELALLWAGSTFLSITTNAIFRICPSRNGCARTSTIPR